MRWYFDEYGIACPSCGQDESIHVVATVWAELTPEGIGEVCEFDWDDDSVCECQKCGTYGILSDFFGRMPDFAVKDEPAA